MAEKTTAFGPARKRGRRRLAVSEPAMTTASTMPATLPEAAPPELLSQPSR